MLNKLGQSIDPCGTSNILNSHSLYELFTLVLCFLFENNHGLVLKQAS